MNNKITFADVKKNEEIRTFIQHADISLEALGFTEHSFAHSTKCAELAGAILKELGYSDNEVELVKIAAYMHDIGNVVNRTDHAQSGALIAFRLLEKMGMPAKDLATIITAIGNHDERTAFPVNAVAAAVILADKTDVRRSRVRCEAMICTDIHDRVNFAVEKNDLVLDKENRVITAFLTIDTNISPVMDYFEIFLDRMLLCRKAATFLKLRFQLNINGKNLL